MEEVPEVGNHGQPRMPEVGPKNMFLFQHVLLNRG